jgi:hypothetical protein
MSGMVVFTGRRRRLAAAGAALAVLAGLTALALAAVSPPAVRPADAPVDQFSADRAYAHVRTIGAQPHVAGGPASELLSRHLVTVLSKIGAVVRAQYATGLDTQGAEAVAAARVKNVTGVLPGTNSTGPVFLVAHYDSVQVAPGGSDDGAGVATVLETMRALAAGPHLRNDVVAVLTDAEEACLCGAEAFVKMHPLSTEGGVALNFEARGTRGPAIMFETSRGNARLAKMYGHVPRPVATSFAVEVYRILPNDTDFTRFREDPRFAGLNTAFIDGSAAYHTPQDTPSRLDLRSLQHEGDGALALARALGNADLRPLRKPAGHDDTYFPAFGVLLRYPGWLVWPIAVAALAAVAVAARLARRRGLISWPRAAAGLALTLVPLLVAPVAAQLGWVALVAARRGYAEMIDPWRPGWFRWAIVALCATVLLGWYALLRRRLGPVALALGGSGALALLGVALAAVAPGGSYLAALPALTGAAAIAGALLLRPPVAALGALVAGGAVAVAVLAPAGYLFFPALGLAVGGAGALCVVLLGLAVLPVLELLFAPVRAGTARPEPAVIEPPAAEPAGAEPAGAEPADAEPADTGSADAAVLAGAEPAASATGTRYAGRPAPVPAGAEPTAAPARAEPGAPVPETGAVPAGTGPATAPGGALPNDADPVDPEPTHPRPRGRRRALAAAVPAIVCGLLVAAFGAAGLATDRFDAVHPMPSQLMYAMDADTGQAYWVSKEKEPGAWTARYVHGREDLSDAYPVLRGELATGPAAAADLPPPRVIVVSDVASGGERALSLRLIPQRRVRLAYLRVQGSPVVQAVIAGRKVSTAQRSRFGVLFHAPPAAGVDIRLVVRPGTPLTLRVMDGSTGLDRLPDFRPRPPDVGIAGDHLSELVLVARTIEIKSQAQAGGGQGPGSGSGQP